MTKIWRIHLKPAAKKYDPRKLCLEENVVGIGWRRQDGDNAKNISWEEYYALAERTYGQNKKDKRAWFSAVTAFKDKLDIDDLVWTRDWHGNYFIGRVTGKWEYRCEDNYSSADIVNIRQCDWKKVGTVDCVPGKVVNSFIPPRTIQQIHSNTVSIFSQKKYNDFLEREYYSYEFLTTNRNIFSLLSAEDCEDVIAIYLQVKFNYIVIPSSCKADTMAYEFVLINRKTNKIAVIQVKTGNESLRGMDYDEIVADEIYLFASSGIYDVKGCSDRIKTILPEEIKTFMRENEKLLPSKIRFWIGVIMENDW